MYKKPGKGKNATKTFYQKKIMSEKTKCRDDMKTPPATTENRFKVLDKEEEMTKDDDIRTQNKQKTNESIQAAQARGQDQMEMPDELKVNRHKVRGGMMDKAQMEDPDLYPEEKACMTHPNFDLSKNVDAQSDNNDQTQQRNQSTYDLDSVSESTPINVERGSSRDEATPASEEDNNIKDSVAQTSVHHGATGVMEALDIVIDEETSYEDDRVVTLRIEHVLRNGKAFDDSDHQRVLKTLSTAQDLKIFSYKSSTAESDPLPLRDVAMFASDWRDFATCVATTQSSTRARQIVFYEVANESSLNLKQLKRNKIVMDFLKSLEVFIFVDNFHQEAT